MGIWTNAKRKVARATGVPTTASGRQRKAKRLFGGLLSGGRSRAGGNGGNTATGCLGCLLLLLVSPALLVCVCAGLLSTSSPRRNPPDVAAQSPAPAPLAADLGDDEGPGSPDLDAAPPPAPAPPSKAPELKAPPAKGPEAPAPESVARPKAPEPATRGPFDDNHTVEPPTYQPGTVLKVQTRKGPAAQVYRNEERRQLGKSFGVLNGEAVKVLTQDGGWLKAEIRSGEYREVVCLIDADDVTNFPPPREAATPVAPAVDGVAPIYAPSGLGGSGGMVWVNGYYRQGRWVNGYWRSR